MPIRVAVVDDHRSFAESLSIAIGLQDGMECVGAANTAADALAMISAEHPDVVLVDVHLPDQSGVEIVRTIKASDPAVKFVMLTSDANPSIVARAVSAGASGFLLKEGPVADIVDAIRSANEGEILVKGTTLAAVLEHLDRGGSPHGEALATLTPREREVLSMLVSGLDAKRIADELTLSIHSVRGHIKNVMAKLGVHSQLEAVAIAVSAGFQPQ